MAVLKYKSRSTRDPMDVTSLPFVKDEEKPRANGSPRNFWAVAPTGDYLEDFRTGREYALAFMAFQHQYQQTQMAGSGMPSMAIVADMIAAGTDSGIERAFFYTLVECSVGHWTTTYLAQCRAFYAQWDRETNPARERHEARSRAAKKAAPKRRRNQRAAG